MIERFVYFCILIVLRLLNGYLAGALVPPSLNSTVNTVRERCTEREDWIAGGYNRNDCFKAIDELYNDDVRPRDGQEYEFLSRGVSKRTSFPTVLLPRKYDVGKQDVP